ncbi:MAG: nucleotidyltransferase family protein [Planctomycetota bacterium]
MSILEELRAKRKEIVQIAARHGVGRIRVFGSVARGDAGPNSDVDFLIEVDGPTTPWFPGGLVADLEGLLGRRVDVVEPDALRESLRGSIEKDAIPL